MHWLGGDSLLCTRAVPEGGLPISAWESLEIRVLREHENVGSNPSALTAGSSIVVWSNGKMAHC